MASHGRPWIGATTKPKTQPQLKITRKSSLGLSMAEFGRIKLRGPRTFIKSDKMTAPRLLTLTLAMLKGLSSTQPYKVRPCDDE